ncbi:hypothetical protein KA107_00675 [Candidatus Pacearchaeota archaeon]|nr:hypothetical protein [Candidatus Pacearchaeota archaeon]
MKKSIIIKSLLVLIILLLGIFIFVTFSPIKLTGNVVSNLFPQVVSWTAMDWGLDAQGYRIPTIKRSGYDYSVTAFKDDDGAYRLFWCGTPSKSGSIDSVYYSWSTKPERDFTSPIVVNDHGCAPTVVKVPGNFTSFCQGSPAYFMYVESSPPIPSTGYGNKIELSYSCNLINWVSVGPVMQISSAGTNYPYGTGHPNAIFLNNKIYLNYYQSTVGTEGGDTGVYLAESYDGIHFSNNQKVGMHAGTEIKYVDSLGFFMGILSDGTLFFKPNISGFVGYQADIGYWGTMQPGKKYKDSMRYTWWCNEGQGILTNSQGIISLSILNQSELSTVIYSGEWDAGSDGRDSQGNCFSAGDPREQKYSSNSDIYATKIILPQITSVPNCTYTYSDWGECTSSGIQARTIASQSPENCQQGIQENLSRPCTFIPLCTESNWQSIQENCSESNLSSKIWTRIGNCSGGVQHNSNEIISCNFNYPVCNNFTYSNWNECLPSGVRARSVVDSYPTDCLNGNPIISETCEYHISYNLSNLEETRVDSFFNNDSDQPINSSPSLEPNKSTNNSIFFEFTISSKEKSNSRFRLLILNFFCKISHLFNKEKYTACFEKLI